MSNVRRHGVYWLFLALALFANLASWGLTRKRQVEWLNVPPVPSRFSLTVSSLGDMQFAYRSLSVMLQNLGDMGGRTTPIREYNFKRVGEWLSLMDELDSRSDFIPYMASYYYGAVNGDAVKEKLKPIVAYLHRVGNSAEGEKWRWLAHAVYLARFKMEDFDYAYSMALELAALYRRDDTDMPVWTLQMPGFVRIDQGDKEAALAIMMSILSSSAEKLHPAEVNHTVSIICERLLTPEQAKSMDLCSES